jgi:type IV pilus assembly protein PilV
MRIITRRRYGQQGSFLIEALIGILVFSLGVLAMVSLGTTAVSTQSDVQYRTAAASLANEIVTGIALQADRLPRATPALALSAFNNSIDDFEFNMGGGVCNFTLGGAGAGKALVTDWETKVRASLPQVPAGGLQIDTTTLKAFSGVRVTVCWQGPADKAPRSHMIETYIN